jgi:hypothetical protein
MTIEKKLKNITTQLEENHGKNTKQHDSESSSMIIDASKNTETIRNTELHPHFYSLYSNETFYMKAL